MTTPTAPDYLIREMSAEDADLLESTLVLGWEPENYSPALSAYVVAVYEARVACQRAISAAWEILRQAPLGSDAGAAYGQAVAEAQRVKYEAIAAAAKACRQARAVEVQS